MSFIESRKRTVVYGGAFNPPTIAHQIIFQATVDYARSNGADVWLLPSGDRTDKTIPTSRSRRIDYIEAMVEDIESDDVPITILTTELDRKISVESYDTYIELCDANPDRDFIWVFGADSTETMLAWKNGDWILENVAMLLIERPGSIINPLVKTYDSLHIPSLDVSSTELRRRIEMKLPFDDITSPAVHALLKTNTAA